MRSVHKAMGPPKDHLTYYSIPEAANSVNAPGKITGFCSMSPKACLFIQQRHRVNSVLNQENRSISASIEYLRSFEPYTRAYLLKDTLKPKCITAKHSRNRTSDPRRADKQRIFALESQTINKPYLLLNESALNMG